MQAVSLLLLPWLLSPLALAASATSDADADGYTPQDGDCDDSDSTISPAADERCDALDDDCDGAVDEGACSCDTETWGDHVYQLCESSKSWTNASTACSDEGYHLVTIDDASEESFVVEHAVGLLSGATWIGLNDRSTEGSFVWEDGATVGYTNWGLLQPDDGLALLPSEDCAAISIPVVGLLTSWSDEECGSSFDYLCEASCEGVTAYEDADGDGVGGDLSHTGCALPDGYVWATGDCDDDDATVTPGASEIADGKDNDCDGHDETWDADGDGLDVLGEEAAGTDPDDADSDDGGVGDGDEVAAGTDPLDGTDDHGAGDSGGSGASGGADSGDGGADSGGSGGSTDDSAQGDDTAPPDGSDGGGDGGGSGGGDDSAAPTADTAIASGGYFGGGGCGCTYEGGGPTPAGGLAILLLPLLTLRRRR